MSETRNMGDFAPVVLPNSVYKGVRYCAEDHCITRLCMYNPGPFCFCHTRIRKRRLEQRRRQEAA